MMILFPAIGSAQETKAEDKPTTPTAKPIKLKPVMKKQPVAVKLDPVFKKVESPKPEPPKPQAVPPPTPVSASAIAPQTAPVAPPTPTATESPATPAGVVAADTATTGTATPALPPAVKTQTRLTAPQLMTQGKGLLDKGQVAAARERFLKLANRYPEAPEAPEALYHAANSLPEPADALEELNMLAEKYPAAEVMPQVRARQAEFSFVLEKYADAARLYTAVLADQPTPELAKLAEARIVYCVAQTGQPADFASAGSGLIEKYPEMAELPELIGPLAEAKLTEGDTAGAGALFAQLAEKAAEPAQAAKALLGLALCAELEGRIAEASELYEKLGKAHPQSPEATLAAYRLVDLAKPLLP